MKNYNHIKQIIFIVVVALILIVTVRQQISINQIKEERDLLQKKYDDLAYENEKLNHELNEPEHDAYERKAYEQGYSDPNKEYYYSD